MTVSLTPQQLIDHLEEVICGEDADTVRWRPDWLASAPTELLAAVGAVEIPVDTTEIRGGHWQPEVDHDADTVEITAVEWPTEDPDAAPHLVPVFEPVKRRRLPALSWRKAVAWLAAKWAILAILAATNTCTAIVVSVAVRLNFRWPLVVGSVLVFLAGLFLLWLAQFPKRETAVTDALVERWVDDHAVNDPPPVGLVERTQHRLASAVDAAVTEQMGVVGDLDAVLTAEDLEWLALPTSTPVRVPEGGCWE